MASQLYTPKQASALTGASRQVIRLYAARYARWLSTEATPEPGRQREFTADDLRLIKFIYELTTTGAQHEDVLRRLAQGELEDYDWLPPEPVKNATGAPSTAEGDNSALVPLERLQATQALLHDARQREDAAAAALAAAQAEIADLRQQLGQAQGELTAVKALRWRSPRWWRALVGGRDE